MFCGKCGTKNPDEAAVCTQCGAQLKPIQSTPASAAGSAPAKAQPVKEKKSSLILTTKKTNKVYCVANFLPDFAILAAAVYCHVRANELLSSYWHRSDGETLMRAAGVLIVLGVLSLVYHTMVGTTYAELFEDRITGSGMVKLQTKSFSLSFDQIQEISTSKGFLNMEAGSAMFLIISTPGRDYKVITTVARANEFIEHYNRIRA